MRTHTLSCPSGMLIQNSCCAVVIHVVPSLLGINFLMQVTCRCALIVRVEYCARHYLVLEK